METAARILQEFDAQGVHRTGTEVDTRSALWLAALARERGATAEVVGFAHARLDPIDAHLEIDDRTAEGVPAFDAPASGPAGLRGTLGALGSDAPIAVETLGPGWELPPGPAVLEARTKNQHLGMVLIALGPKIHFPAGYALLNADAFSHPYGPPVLQLPSTDADWVTEALAKRRTATLVTHSTRTTVEAYNVELRIPGSNPALAPLVIMTPRSAWWQCTSERGGGLVAWLECVRTLVQHDCQRDVICIATTGHELGHQGLDDFLARYPALVADAHAWIHLGANLGAAVRSSLRLQTSSSELERIADDALGRAGIAPDHRVHGGERPIGEARNVFDGGGRYVSMLGGNGLFHTPADRWPESVDLDRVVALSAAVAQIAVELAGAR